jgi:CD209 antigen
MGFASLVTWDGAAATCDLMGAHLASISSAAENEAVAAVAVEVATTAWIGLTDQWSERTFIWYEGPGSVRAPVYTNWAAGQPDDAPSASGDCALLTGAAATWSDQPCAEVHAFVCEHEWDSAR